MLVLDLTLGADNPRITHSPTHLRRTFNIANFNYRQGVAFQCLARHTDALAAFANGLAQDPKSPQLLDGLVEAAMKSPLKPTLEPTYR